LCDLDDHELPQVGVWDGRDGTVRQMTRHGRVHARSTATTNTISIHRLIVALTAQMIDQADCLSDARDRCVTDPPQLIAALVLRNKRVCPAFPRRASPAIEMIRPFLGPER
jgi:hypothetical protein